MNDLPPVATVDHATAEVITNQVSEAKKEADKQLNVIDEVAKQLNPDGRTPQYHVFKSTYPSLQFVTRKGRYIQFRDGLYFTNETMVIAELSYEIVNGHPHMYVDTNYAYVDELPEIKAASDRERIRLEVRAELMREMGYTPGAENRLGGISNSHNVSEAMAGSASTPQQVLQRMVKINRPSK